MAKKAYIGIITEIPIYEETTTTTSKSFGSLNGSTIVQYFTVTREDEYSFYPSGTVFYSDNAGVDGSIASITLTAKFNMPTVSFSYDCYSETGYDELTVTVAGNTIDTVSGGAGGRWSGSLAKGESITFSYEKDSSESASDDMASFWDLTGTYEETTTERDQVGTETKSVARKIKNAYIGIESIARRIKKAYIGIGGIARPCWNDGELVYYGTITPLKSARYGLAATSVGNYALFGGGYDDSYYSNRVDAYNTSLTSSTLWLQIQAYELSAASIGDYAIFGGGLISGGATTYVTAFNSALTATYPTSLSASVYRTEATSVGNYALFANSYTSSDAYSESLTKVTTSTFSSPRSYVSSTTIGDYALFGGGSNSQVVDAYNSSLTRTTPANLSTSRRSPAAVTVGDYALFCGGYSQDQYYTKTIDVYDKALTRTTPETLTLYQGVEQPSATSIGNYALVGGGSDGNQPKSAMNIFDTSLTRTLDNNLSAARWGAAATTVGDYALFAGGRTFTYDYDNGGYTHLYNYAVVDVYTVT